MSLDRPRPPLLPYPTYARFPDNRNPLHLCALESNAKATFSDLDSIPRNARITRESQRFPGGLMLVTVQLQTSCSTCCLVSVLLTSDAKNQNSQVLVLKLFRVQLVHVSKLACLL